MRFDGLKEQVANLKLWQGIVIVTDISLVGWLLPAGDTVERPRAFLAVLGIMETLVTIVAFCVVLVIVGIALDAARRK